MQRRQDTRESDITGLQLEAQQKEEEEEEEDEKKK